MRKLWLATAAAVAVVATPAAARDGSGYIGLEGGVLFPKDQDIDAVVDFEDNTDVADVVADNVAGLDFNTGYDLDLVGGYDFGMCCPTPSSRMFGERWIGSSQAGWPRGRALERPTRASPCTAN